MSSRIRRPLQLGKNVSSLTRPSRLSLSHALPLGIDFVFSSSQTNSREVDLLDTGRSTSESELVELLAIFNWTKRRLTSWTRECGLRWRLWVFLMWCGLSGICQVNCNILRRRLSFVTGITSRVFPGSQSLLTSSYFCHFGRLSTIVSKLDGFA